jgi:hypothetical protein
VVQNSCLPANGIAMAYRIYLYNEIAEQDLDLQRVVGYLRERCSFAELEVRENFIAHFCTADLIKGLAGCWETGLLAERGGGQTEQERLDYEQQAYQKPGTISANVIYHGWRLLELLQSRIPHAEASLDKLHLMLTPRLIVTKAEGDNRYHARTILGGQLSIISSFGLVEAPARPTEYYLLQRAYHMLGQEIPDAELKQRFKGQFLTCHDSRLTEVILGYLLQAVAYCFFGEGFCDNPHCRLFNAHKQQEMLVAQLEQPEFCERHEGLFGRRVVV